MQSIRKKKRVDRKKTYAAILWLLVGVAMSVVPFFFVYQLITPMLGYGKVDTFGVIWRILAVALCGSLYAIFYVHGLALSHESAYHILENIRVSLQGKLEKQPLGTIQEKGVGTIKKMFIDDIETIELLLAHAIPEGVSNFAIPVFVFIAMFFVEFVVKGICTLPHLVLILCMSFGIGAPLLRALSFMANIPQLNYKIESLERMMDEKPLQQSNQLFSRKDHTVSFENVRFSYIEKEDMEKKTSSGHAKQKIKETEVLHGISLTADAGKVTALVGESGSGKSTLAKLVVHYYDVSGGSIKIGGQDLRDMSIESLNQEISYVSQEQFLFHMSLLENIRLGKPDATDEEVKMAAQKARCYDFIMRLPNGFDTMVGEGGESLSGGEKQRISIARCILKDAPIVILDEATASVDADNERHIQEAISELCEGKTLLVIAHRLNTICDAEQILVISDGEIEDRGKHEELLKREGIYKQFVQGRQNAMRWKLV